MTFFRKARKKIFPTAHRVLLESRLKKDLKQLRGDVLIVGAGRERHDLLMSQAKRVFRSDIDESIEGLDYYVDVHDLPFSDDEFDGVVAIETFEHLASPATAVSEIRRVLRKDGMLLLAIPFMFHIHGDPKDFSRFTEDGLNVLLQGFANVEIAPFGGRLHVVSDIVTTHNKIFVSFRLINHLICLGVLGRLRSTDCPSGYVVWASK